MCTCRAFSVGQQIPLLRWYTVDDCFKFITWWQACIAQQNVSHVSWKLFFFFLYISHTVTVCAFPSAVSVRRSCSWKHPQSCIFVNWRGSGSGGCWGRGGGWGCQQKIAWLTFQPQPLRAARCEHVATVEGLCVCVYTSGCVEVD